MNGHRTRQAHALRGPNKDSAVPNTSWLDDSGLAVNDGVCCDESGRALGATDVFAVGDAAAWWDPLAGGDPHGFEVWRQVVGARVLEPSTHDD
ncbi:hypothetical protein GCM10010094_41820 [Streptomyces flaveus]|uniref:FAD/NAD(P)-binding domain-containing protein n=1 Tax=Streptomyces flaveus TaxID=66370 RepID=A0A917VH72_9ACTN|nr:hypothetical protein GCM10010094_41820 [Streptomyces flaveus]